MDPATAKDTRKTLTSTLREAHLGTARGKEAVLGRQRIRSSFPLCSTWCIHLLFNSIGIQMGLGVSFDKYKSEYPRGGAPRRVPSRIVQRFEVRVSLYSTSQAFSASAETSSLPSRTQRERVPSLPDRRPPTCTCPRKPFTKSLSFHRGESTSPLTPPGHTGTALKNHRCVRSHMQFPSLTR